MLDENEPNAGASGPDGETTEQARGGRRRGAARRPAGPPPAIPDETSSTPVTVPAMKAAPSVTEAKPLPGVAVQLAGGAPEEIIASVRTAAPRAADAKAGEAAGETGSEETTPAAETTPVAETAPAEEVAPKRATR